VDVAVGRGLGDDAAVDDAVRADADEEPDLYAEVAAAAAAAARPAGRRKPMSFTRDEFRRRSSGGLSLEDDGDPFLDGPEEDRVAEALDAALDGGLAGETSCVVLPAAAGPLPDYIVPRLASPQHALPPSDGAAAPEAAAPPKAVEAAAPAAPAAAPAPGASPRDAPATKLPALAAAHAGQPKRKSLFSRFFRRSIS